MGVSGIGFSMKWKWEPGGVNLLCPDRHQVEHMKRCFDALGLDFAVLVNRSHELAAHLDSSRSRAGSEEDFRQAVRESIDRGMPCIAFGVYPIPEACLLAGYDRDGEVLMGWSHFQRFPEKAASDRVSFDARGRFVKTGWIRGSADACRARRSDRRGGEDRGGDRPRIGEHRSVGP